MIAVDNWLEQQNDNAVRMIMQVHDELVFEVKAGAVEEASQKIRALMEGSVQLDVPLLVEVGVGDNWDEAH
jgi:DNA polymerase-1